MTAIYNVGFPFIIVHILRLSNFQYSLTEAIYSLGLVLGGIVVSGLSFGKDALKVVNRALIVTGLPIILVLFPLISRLNSWVTVGLFAVLYLVSSVALVFINVPQMTYMQENIPTYYQGRVLTLLSVGSTSLQPLGLFVCSVLFEYVSPSLIIILSFLGFIFLGLIAFLTLKKDTGTQLTVHS